jgi:hypothetical protein
MFGITEEFPFGTADNDNAFFGKKQAFSWTIPVITRSETPKLKSDL